MRMLKSAVLCATALVPVPVPALANVAEESEHMGPEVIVRVNVHVVDDRVGEARDTIEEPACQII